MVSIYYIFSSIKIMAICNLFVCTHCSKSITAWEDYNCYYYDKSGKKIYAYHPDHESLEKCIAYDLPYLCLDCGRKLKIDSQKPKECCTKRACKSFNIMPFTEIENEICPFCKIGTFQKDPDFFRIS